MRDQPRCVTNLDARPTSMQATNLNTDDLTTEWQWLEAGPTIDGAIPIYPKAARMDPMRDPTCVSHIHDKFHLFDSLSTPTKSIRLLRDRRLCTGSYDMSTSPHLHLALRKRCDGNLCFIRGNIRAPPGEKHMPNCQIRQPT